MKHAIKIYRISFSIEGVIDYDIIDMVRDCYGKDKRLIAVALDLKPHHRGYESVSDSFLFIIDKYIKKPCFSLRV